MLLAQLLKKDAPAYRGLPDTPDGKILYAQELYQALLSRHLLCDRERLFSYLAYWDTLAELCENLTDLNHQLMLDFENLNTPTPVEELDIIGRRLERYVRTKERSLFEEAQQCLGEGDFTDLETKLRAC